MEYYRIHAATMDPCTPDREHFDRSQAVWCPECSALVSCSGPLTMRIQGTRLSRSPLNMVHGYSDVGLIRADLLAAIPSEVVSASLVVGPLHGDDGRPIPEWHCFYSPHRLIVRGSSHVSLRHCARCRHPYYFARGESYLCPAPRSDISLFHPGWCVLVVDERVFQAVAPLIERRLRADRLPVLTEPRDGLTHEIEFTTTAA